MELKEDEAFAYDENSFDLIGKVKRQPNPARPGTYLDPANSTREPLPKKIGKNNWPKFNKEKNKWELVLDNTYYYEKSKRGLYLYGRCQLAMAYIVDRTIDDYLLEGSTVKIKKALLYGEIEKARLAIEMAKIDQDIKSELHEILQQKYYTN